MAEWWSDESLVKVLEEEAEQGNPKAMSELARKLILEGNTPEGLEWFHKAAEGGDRDAMFNLGLLYEQGIDGASPEYDRALACFIQAGEAGDTEGMYKAAQYKLAAFGCDKDEAGAAALLKKALGLGFLPAQDLLYQIPGMKEEREAKISSFRQDSVNAENQLESGHFEEAIALLRKLLTSCVDTFGEMDAYSVSVMNNLAVALSSVGSYEESIPLKERVLELRGKSLPLTHPDYITAMTNLTSDYAHVHRYQTALQFSRQAYTAVRESLPILHELTFLTLNRLACDLMSVCRHKEAYAELEEVSNLANEACKGEPDQLEGMEHWKQTLALKALCMKEMEENPVYFELEESRRNYAYICAELMEMLSALPESYLARIHERELMHLKEQADLVGCYKPRMNQGQAVETDPYTNTLQTLLSYKYLMPGLAECRETGRELSCRALVSWIQNELCMIVTIYPERCMLPHMDCPQPVDYVKALNAKDDDGDRVISIDSVDLQLQEMEDHVQIRFAYGSEGRYRMLTMKYHRDSNLLEGDNSFILLA